MSPTHQAPQESTPPSSPTVCAASPCQVQAYSISGHGPQSPQEASTVNTRLVEELRSVVIMNDKWQKYHKQQEKFIAELQENLEQQRKKTAEFEKKYSHSILTQRLQEKKLKDQDNTIKCFSSLMDELDEAKQRIQEFETEVKEFKPKVKRTDVNLSKDGDEKIKHLQYQVQACIDDFKKEETQKLRLQNEVVSLSSELTEAKRLLADYREKVNMMKSINFPTIHKGDMEVNKIPTERTRRRNRMSSSAPTKSAISCRLDGMSGMINFPTTIEADSLGSPHGFELAPKFSSSLESEDTESDVQSNVESFENLELVRH